MSTPVARRFLPIATAGLVASFAATAAAQTPPATPVAATAATAATASASSPPPRTVAELDKIRSAGEIVVAHRDTSIPFSYVGADKQQPLGYAVDICRRLVDAVRLQLKLPNLRLRYLPVTSASRIPAIVNGEASLECGSTTNTAERRKSVDFTIAHFISSARLLVRADTPYEKLEDLAGRSVVSTKGTTNIKTLERLNAEYLLKLRIDEAVDHAQAFRSVAEGRADAFAMDDVLLFGLRANADQPTAFKVVGKPMSIEPYAVMLPRGDTAFKKLIDDEMRRLIADGTVQTLYDKWFLQPIPPKGINLQLPMSQLLRGSLRFPSDKVGDLG